MQFKKQRNRFVRPIGIGLFILQMVIFHLGVTIATSGTTVPHSDDQYVSNHLTDILKIQSVLENKIGNQQLLEKTKDKLLTLSDGQTWLIASLSDRVKKEGNTTVGDIAFLLMTALITLS
jgi:hypothetical protein